MAEILIIQITEGCLEYYITVFPVKVVRIWLKPLVQKIIYSFIPDQRKFTFRLLGKPSLALSPPVIIY